MAYPHNLPYSCCFDECALSLYFYFFLLNSYFKILLSKELKYVHSSSRKIPLRMPIYNNSPCFCIGNTLLSIVTCGTVNGILPSKIDIKATVTFSLLLFHCLKIVKFLLIQPVHVLYIVPPLPRQSLTCRFQFMGAASL